MKRLQRRDESGAAAVEFALVLPILLMVVFAIIAYGFVFAQTLSLSNSARQAARSAVADYGNGATCKSINSLAKDASSTLGMDGAGTTVQVYRGDTEVHAVAAPQWCNGAGTDNIKPCTGSTVGSDNIYVRISYSGGAVVPLVPTPSTLTGKGVYRCEFSASSTS